MVCAIGLTAARTVTLHLISYSGSPELLDRYGAALGPFFDTEEVTGSNPVRPTIELQKLKRDAEAYLGEKITDAVSTVPTYVRDAQRQATKEAVIEICS